MGTQMQSETYFSRHCPRSLSRSISTRRWLPYQEGRVRENRQHGESSSPWSGLRDRHSGPDKAKVKETILEHEVIFRHQVLELHRLYRRQRELMNAVQENKLYNCQKKAELSQSITFPSFMSSESAKRIPDGFAFHASDTMIGRLEPSSSIVGKSPSTVLKRNHFESLNLCRDMYLHKPASLQVSGGAHMNKEKTTTEREYLTANVSLGFSLQTGTSRYSTPAMNGKTFLNRSPSAGHEGNRKEQKSYGFKFNTDLSLDIEHKTEGRKKRKLFGVEIAEEVDESPLVSSHANNSYPKSNAAESNTSHLLSMRPTARHLNRKVSSPRGSHGIAHSEPSWLKLGSCLQNLEFVGSKDARDASKYSVPRSDLFHTTSLCVHPQRNPELINGGAAALLDISNGRHAFTSLPDLFEFYDSSNRWMRVNSEQMKSRRILKFDSETTNMPENSSHHFFNIPKRAEIPSKEFNLEKSIKGTEDKKDDHAIEKRVGFPSTEMISKSHIMDLPTDVVSERSPIQHVAYPKAVGTSLSNNISALRNHIDLNLSIVEEETPGTVVPFTSMKNIRPEIGLEVAAVIESEVQHGGTKSLKKSDEPQENLIEEAAEALVVISSALTIDTCHLENTSNCLHWFADVICSYTSDEDGRVRKLSERIDGCCDEEFLPVGMDYFEFMTLQLKGVKEETQCYSHSDTEHQKPEETKISATKRRFGRGHGRRGRQRKDFQKHILPDLVSLAKQEVVEDLQTLAGLFHSTGKTWKSGLSRRHGAKNNRNGIKSGDSLNTTEANSALLPTKQKQNGRDLQPRGKHFTGWGKRTQRLPRQRCSRTSSSIQLLNSD